MNQATICPCPLLQKFSLFTLLLVFIALPYKIQANQVRNSYVLEKHSRYNEAYTLMHKLADNNARHYLAHLRAGWLAYKCNKYDASVYYYRKAVVLAPNSIEPRLGLMLPLIASKRYKEAETVGRAVLSKDYKNYLARGRMAWALYLSGRYKEAQAYYYYLIIDYPSDGNMYVGMGATLLAQNQIKSACYYYKIANTILPGDKRVTQGIRYCK